MLHHFVNKTLDVPHSGSNASIICTILSLLNLVKSVQTHQHKYGSMQTAVTGNMKGMMNQSG
ncbi:hypothetical protein ACU64_23370 [Escherichia coli]|nr:hypothetical protein ACU64_23370 [Escherichia coli]